MYWPSRKPSQLVTMKSTMRRALPPIITWNAKPTIVAITKANMNMGFGIVLAIRFSSGKIKSQCSTKRESSHAIVAKAMNVIDLEILIPASPEFIWRFLGDPAALPQWQEDVTSVSFLSTQREGQGTRWRATAEKSKDVVVEVSAWYDTLGYEYRLMDGSSFTDNQGRIRLHEVADGTLVRWTFQYQLGGVLGGLRNAMRLKRSTTNQLQASLRNLHQLILQESGGISTHEAKASVREAPDVDERLSYQPRHPTAFHDVMPDGDAKAAINKQPVSYDEIEAKPLPFVADTDTKPNPVVIASGDEEQLLAAPEPAPDDTKPIQISPPIAEAPVKHKPRPEPVAEPKWREEAPLSPPAPSAMPAAPALSKEARDAAQLSVFEVFGLKKPSESSPSDSPAAPAREAERDSRVPAPYPRHDDREPAPRFESQPEPAPRVESRLQAAEMDGRYQSVTGWRRKARRRKTVIRSHN